jgi:hypothetical protein
MKAFFIMWTRKFHWWIAVPTVIIIPLVVISKFSRAGTEHLPPQIEVFQSILMLLLVISGSYLYLIPYFTSGRFRYNFNWMMFFGHHRPSPWSSWNNLGRRAVNVEQSGLPGLSQFLSNSGKRPHRCWPDRLLVTFMRPAFGIFTC